jgi:hypothetical protein
MFAQKHLGYTPAPGLLYLLAFYLETSRSRWLYLEVRLPWGSGWDCPLTH